MGHLSPGPNQNAFLPGFQSGCLEEGDPETHENEQSQHGTEEQQAASDIPRITVNDPAKNPVRVKYESSSSTEREMSSSHRSSRHESSRHSSHSSKSYSSSSKSKSKKDDWSEITDPEERRRVQNRIAQRKFRDKAKETKERQDRDAENQAHAGHSYHTPDPGEMGTDDELSGLPWGSLSLRHVVSKGKAKEEDSKRGSRRDEDRSNSWGSQDTSYQGGDAGYQGGESYQGGDAYYEDDTTYYEDPDRVYYDYGSGGSSR